MGEYFIQQDTMTEFAKQARRLSSNEDELNGAEIAEIYSRTQGSVKTTGKHEIKAFDARGNIIKSGMYDTDEIFAFPKISEQHDLVEQFVNPDGIIEYKTIATFQGWTATSLINNNLYMPINDMPIYIGAKYKPVDDCLILVINIENDNTTIAFGCSTYDFNATIDFGDGTIQQVSREMSHLYEVCGKYLIKIHHKKTDNKFCCFDISASDSSSAKIVCAVFPAWSTVSFTNNNNNKTLLNNIECIIFEDGCDVESTSCNSSTLLKYVCLPSDLQYVNNGLFYNNSSIENVILPYGVTTISHNAFYRCVNLKNIIIPNSVTTIDSRAFFECNFTDVVIPDNVTSIGVGCFYNCKNLINIKIGSNITVIPPEAFYNNNFKEIILPSVTSIGYDAFYSCDVKTIVLQANEVCNLVTSDNGFDAFGSTYFNNPIWADECSIYVPDSLVDSYKSTECWADYVAFIKPLSEYVEAE